VAALSFVTLLGAGIARPGAGRAGMIAGGLTLGLLAPAVATAYASRKLLAHFAGMLAAGGPEMLLEACASLWQLQRLAWGAFAACCVLGLLLGMLRFGKSAEDPPCSTRRAAVLLLLPLLALAVSSALTHRLGLGLRVTAAVVSSVGSEPDSRTRSDVILQGAGLRTEGPGALGETSAYVVRTASVGLFGGALTVVVLLGLSVPGFILAWRVSFGPSFTVLASAMWLMAAAGAAAVASGVLDPLRLP
jgi:hypothetical protein